MAQQITSRVHSSEVSSSVDAPDENVINGFVRNVADDNSRDEGAADNERKTALHQILESMKIDGDALEDALHRSQQNPIDGYDDSFGRPAIRAYKSFVYPKKDRGDKERQRGHGQAGDLSSIALGCARQIKFLIQRHRSHVIELVRHHDSPQQKEDTSNSERRTFPLTIMLENIRSAFNVGSIFRSADACGCREVITTGISPHPFGSGSEKLRKTSLGADLFVPTRHFNDTISAINELRRTHNKIAIFGIEVTSKSICYTREDLYPKDDGGTVLVFGNEKTGVDIEIMPLLDAIIEVPMFGETNSLNVASCAPVIMFEVLRQWGAMNEDRLRRTHRTVREKF